jgi:hypothetical protein
MRHARGQQGDGIELLRLDRLAGLCPSRGEIVKDQRETHQGGVFILQRNEVKVQITGLRVEDFEVAADHPALGQDLRPVELFEMLGHERSHRFLRIDSQQRGDGVVEIANPSLGIDHHDPFLERIEDRLEKTLLVVQPLKICLQIALTYPVDAIQQLIEEGVFQGGRKSE